MFDPTTLPGYTAGPVDWFTPDDSFGGHVYYGLEISGERVEDE